MKRYHVVALDEAADEIRVGADVDRGHADHRDVAARVLPDGERADRLEPRDENDQADNDCQDGPPDEQIRELHQLFSGLGAGLLAGRTALLICTATPLRSLKTPEVTTSSPGLMPDNTATWSPRAGPSLTNC